MQGSPTNPGLNDLNHPPDPISVFDTNRDFILNNHDIERWHGPQWNLRAWNGSGQGLSIVGRLIIGFGMLFGLCGCLPEMSSQSSETAELAGAGACLGDETRSERSGPPTYLAASRKFSIWSSRQLDGDTEIYALFHEDTTCILRMEIPTAQVEISQVPGITNLFDIVTAPRVEDYGSRSFYGFLSNRQLNYSVQMEFLRTCRIQGDGNCDRRLQIWAEENTANLRAPLNQGVVELDVVETGVFWRGRKIN